MNAHKFVAERGIERARDVVELAPQGATHLSKDTGHYVNANFEPMPAHIKEQLPSLIVIAELKQVVESVEIVEQLGELNSVKKKLYGKHIGYTHFNVGANGRWAFLDHYVDFIPDSAYHIGLINKHIADYELVESYKELDNG